MKKNVLVLFFVSLLFTGFAQNFNPNDALPLDKDVHYGKLDNGLTYYVRHNDKPENRAYLQLVVNAGSVLENDNQRGLAHMCEHMAFNGTKNFPKHKLIEFLESLGMRFGADLNAYTSFDETVYMIEIPLDSTGYLSKGLQVIYDWASDVSYETDEINAERGVIREEWRLGRGAQDRLTRQTFPAVLYKSLYAKRLPIGDTTVFMHCPPDNLRSFYKDWYRPDLQAVIVVGDFDADKVTEQVKKLFSQIPARKNERPRIYPEIPDHKKTIVKVATDKEAPYTILSIYMKNKFSTVKTYADLKNQIIDELATGMLNMRFSELSKKPDAPFAYVGVGYGQFLGKKSAFNFFAIVKNDKILDAVTKGTEEIQRAKKFGYTQSEFERQKKVLLSDVKKQFDDKKKLSSDKWARILHKNFGLSKSPAYSFDLKYKLYRTYLPEITLNDVNKAIDKMVIDKNTVITLTAPKIDVPSEKEILDTYNTAEKSDIKAYVEDKISDKLISKEPAAGKVVNEKKDDVTGTTVWTLNNGIKVVLKPTEFKDNEILMKAYSYGGYSLYPNDIINAKNCADIADNSGVGDFNNIQLSKFLSDKQVSCSPFVSLSTEGINGNSTVDDFPVMMQLTYLYFMQPRFDDDAFQTYIQQQKTILTNSANSPQSVWRDSLFSNLYNHSPFMTPMTLKDLPKIDNKKAEKIYKERFSDPASFTFIFTGNIDPGKIKPLIEKYLGSLSSVNKKETIQHPDLLIPKKTKMVYATKGSDPKSLVYTIFSGTAKQNLKNQIYLKALSFVLTDSLLDQIREKNQWTYSISANSSFKSLVNNQYTIGIFFSSSPENVSKVNKRIMRIAKNFSSVEIPDEEMQKTIEKLKREYETNIKTNKYWINQLLYMYQTGGKPDFVTNYSDITDSLNKKILKKQAEKLLHDYYLSIILIPENTK